MIVPQYVIYVLIYDYQKFRKDPSITSQEIANYISVALAVALSVYCIDVNVHHNFSVLFSVVCKRMSIHCIYMPILHYVIAWL